MEEEERVKLLEQALIYLENPTSMNLHPELEQLSEIEWMGLEAMLELLKSERMRSQLH